MPIIQLYTLERLDFLGTDPFALTQITQRSIDPAVEEVLGSGAGQAAPSFSAVMSQQPMITAEATEIGRLVEKIGQTGAFAIPNAPANTELDAWFAKFEPQGSRAAGAVQFKVGVNKGMVVLGELRAPLGSVASQQVAIHSLSDGVNLPFTYADGQTLPATTPVVDQLYTLGPGFIEGVQITGNIGMAYNPSNVVVKEATDGAVYPTFGWIQTLEPTIVVQSNDALNLSTFGLSGSGVTATPADFYLQAIALDGTRQPNTDPVHIRIRVNADQGMITMGPATGANNEAAETEIRVRPRVGATEVITVDANVAIPPFT